ncbi:hypothetical protein Q9233_017052 [Columba guinea]|nr:hypothetical protein Q9233_017052 [Columba guinea]
MEAVIEKECSALGGLFQTIISDMKGSYPVWEDFINKAGKLQSQLRTTVVAAAAFLDAFQKVADMATNTRGKKLVPSKVHTTTHLPSMNIAKGLLSQSGKKSVLCSVKRKLVRKLVLALCISHALSFVKALILTVAKCSGKAKLCSDLAEELGS